ncbi:golgin subfamily A member 6-like protein 22 [Clytia hemisphaerica]|uniref:golgin subfamily A member 6-like protein 22 n=1 Tax=Clytia hemisphaerica TaxID=252671 RepID=UPI0034D3CFDA
MILRKVQIARSDSPPIPTVAKQQQKRKERERKLSLVSNHTEENEMSPNIQTTTMTNNEMRTTTHTTNHRPDSAITRHQQQPQKQQKQLTSDEEYLNTIRKSIEVQQQINETDVEQQGHVIKQLAHLRSQLQQQERKIKTELQINEKAKRKRHIQQSYQEKQPIDPYKDSSRKYGKELDYEQRKLMRQQEERLNDLRKKIESDKAQMKYSSTTNNKPKYNSRGSAKSLLDSESQFISLRDYQDITDQVLNNNRNPPTFNRKPTTDNSSTKEKNTRYSGATRSTTSARARRREKEKAEMDNIFQEYFPLEKEIDTSSTFDMDRISMRNEERLKKFKQIESNNHNDNETEDNNGDADDIVRKFMNQT